MPSLNLNANSIVVRKSDVLASEVGGEIVIMNMTAGLYFGLNAIASVIWQELQQPVQVSKLCAVLFERYSGDYAVIEQDILVLLNKLSDRRLIDVCP